MSGVFASITWVRVVRLVKAPLVAIVDDDDDVREALSDLIVVLGLGCRMFDRAEALLAEYEPGAFDCIVTDVKMPGIDGFELLRRLRKAARSVPVIVVTSDSSPKTLVRALEGGAHACLTKPIEAHVLLGHLQVVLARGGFEADGDGKEGTDG